MSEDSMFARGRCVGALILVAALFAGLPACDNSSDDQGRFAFDLTLTGLPDSTGTRTHYEGWVIIGNGVISTGKFRLLGTGPTAIVQTVPQGDNIGTAANAVFGPSSTFLGEDFPLVESATAFFITLEPEGDRDNIPSCQVLMAGELIDNEGTFDAAGILVPDTIVCAVPTAAPGMGRLGFGDFSTASGTFQLRSPTDDSNPVDNDFAGVWFVQNDGVGGIEAGTSLPALPEGLCYEGWAIVDGATRSLGRFKTSSGPDQDSMTAPQRGNDPGLQFPGRDFVLPLNPVNMFEPPALMLSQDAFDPEGDYCAFIAVEPFPDNDERFFGIEVLNAPIAPGLVNTDGSSNQLTTMERSMGAQPIASVLINGTGLLFEDVFLPQLVEGSTYTERRGHYALWAMPPQSIALPGVPLTPRLLARFLEVDGLLLSVIDQSFLGTPANFPVTDVAAGFDPFDLSTSQSVFITFEQEGVRDPMPSDRIMIGAQMSPTGAVITVEGQSGPDSPRLADFSFAMGEFQLDTPTNDVEGQPLDDGQGILFGTSSGEPLLSLPELPSGWRYEGFVQELATGRIFSTGAFRSTMESDSNDGISLSRGPELKPGVPGEDFLNDVAAPMFPAAISGSITRVFITIESVPASSREPSDLIVLDAMVPASAEVGGVGKIDVPMAAMNPGAGFSGSLSVRSVDPD